MPCMACKESEVDPGCQQSASNCTSCSLAWLVRASEVSTVYLRRHGEEAGSGVGPETEAKSSHGRGHRAMQAVLHLHPSTPQPPIVQTAELGQMGSNGWSCIEAGAVATATVGRVGEYEATTGPGRAAWSDPWLLAAPGALRRRRHPSGAALARPLRTWAVISRLATQGIRTAWHATGPGLNPSATRLGASLGLVPVH